MIRKSGWMIVLILMSLIWPASALPYDESSGQVLGGSANSPIQIEVFSDFECSACREFYLGTVRQILQEYSSKDKVCFIYHEFPLSIPSHKYSRDAARYAEAAGKLGVKQLLAVMDALFMDQAVWSQDGKIEPSIAKVLSRDDFQKLKNALSDSNINLAIEREIDLGNKNQVRSTPTMFIRYTGKQQKVEGVVTYVVLKQFIDNIVK
ncbi:MAG TPA: thioredoxin domain-containing protein [Acidobacteriota bacterium]|nr:thioredoxin domain-containing protein [Acidobacteriota bacterium]